jgi:hypothetical protein
MAAAACPWICKPTKNMSPWAPRTAPRSFPRRRDEPDADGGRGVLIIEALSSGWGVHDHHGGKRVWVQLRPHPAS